MIRTLLGRAAVALQRARDARSIENQRYYAAEARRAFEAARRSAVCRRSERVDREAAMAALAALAARELEAFEAQLSAVENRILRRS